MTAWSLTPMLTAKNAVAAIEFYRDAFDAVETSALHSAAGHVVAEMAIDGLPFFVVDENPEAFNLSPTSLDGTTVRINLIVDNPDATAAHAVGAGRARSFQSPISPTAFGKDESRILTVITG